MDLQSDRIEIDQPAMKETKHSHKISIIAPFVIIGNYICA